jgi:ubiquinone/menaquinone biosynthesis C-methylase UbiE
VPPEIFEFLLRERKLNYHTFDVDRTVIDDLKARTASIGLPPSNFQCGEISNLPFDEKFDFVFSSHCLEHSMDIVATLAEIRRVLREGGHLFMSVPLGFDASDEHIFYLGPQEWIALLAAAGFEVVSHSIGTVFVNAVDVSFLAKKTSLVPYDEKRSRDIAKRFSKAGSILIDHKNESFSYPNGTIHTGYESMLVGKGAICALKLPGRPRSLVVVRHSWSGCVKISDGYRQYFLDAYHHIHHRVGIDLSGFDRLLSVEVVGKNSLSMGTQLGIVGVLLEDE